MLRYLCDTPLDSHRTPSAIGSATVRPFLAYHNVQAGSLNRLILRPCCCKTSLLHLELGQLSLGMMRCLCLLIGMPSHQYSLISG